MAEGDEWFRYSVAWIDLDGQGQAPRPRRADPGRPRHRSTWWRRSRPSTRSPTTPASASPCRRSCPGPASINHTTIKAFNELWYRKAPRRRVSQISRSPASSIPSTWSGRGTACTAAAGSCSTSSCVPFGAGGRPAPRHRAPRGVAARRASSPCSSASVPPTRRRSASRRRAGRWPSTCRRRRADLRRAAPRPRRPRARRRRAPLPGQGQPHDAGRRAAGLPAPRRVAGHRGARSIRRASGSATRPAGCACSTTDLRRIHGQRTRRTTDHRAARRHQRHRAGDRRAPGGADDAHRGAGRAAARRRPARRSSSGRG